MCWFSNSERLIDPLVLFVSQMMFFQIVVTLQISARTKYFSFVFWSFNLFFLLCNRVYDGYSFSTFGWVIYWLLERVNKLSLLLLLSTCAYYVHSQKWAFLDNYRGTFRWHICFNFGTLFPLFQCLAILLSWLTFVASSHTNMWFYLLVPRQLFCAW